MTESRYSPDVQAQIQNILALIKTTFYTRTGRYKTPVNVPRALGVRARRSDYLVAGLAVHRRR